jgi:hypothetical protein
MELPVRVTLLGEKPVSFDSAIVTLAPRELSVRSIAPLTLRAAIKVESANQLWMGQVIEVRREGQAWLAAVRIEHALRDIADLMRLADRFVGKSEPAEEKIPAPGLRPMPRAVP